MMKRYLIFAGLAVLLSLGSLHGVSAGEESQKIALQSEVSVNNEIVMVGNLVTGAPPPLASKPILRAPRPGYRAHLPVEQIRALLSRAGVKEFDHRGLSFVALSRSSRRFSPGDIEAIIEEEVRQRTAFDPGAILDLSFNPPLRPLHIETSSRQPLMLTAFSFRKLSGRFSAELLVADSAISSNFPTKVTGRITEVVNVVALKGRKKRGDILRKGDLEIISLPIRRYRPGLVVDESEVLGKELKRAIGEGRPFSLRDVAPPLLARRNKPVDLNFTTGSLSIKSTGIAKDNGALGDVIRVENPTSGKIIKARVVGQGIAEPLPGPGTGKPAPEASRYLASTQ